MEYEFPFDVPEDLTTLSRKDFDAFAAQVDEHAKTIAADEDSSLEAIDATFALREKVDERRAVYAASDAKRAQLSTAPAEDGDDASDAGDDAGEDAAGDEGGDEAEGADADAVTASEGTKPPKLAKVARRAPKAADQAPANAEPAFATMVAAMDVPDFVSGQKLTKFSDAAGAVDARMASYAIGTGRRGGRRIPKDQVDAMKAGGQFSMGAPSRHGAVRFNRQFPEDQRISADGGNAYERLLAISDEHRLPGGSLAKSAEQAVAEGRALTAAAGWCAPSETIYSLCDLESMDGLLDLPELQAARGGFNIPEDGGPDFSSIWTSIGAAGDTHLTEYDVENDTLKVCTAIPCPDFVDTRLGVDYVCLTGGLLQRRGYPEVVERFSRGAIVALAHKINQGVIADIVAAAGAATVIPADPTGDDAAAAVLSAVDLGITDMKYRNRMPFASTVEVVLPLWAIVPIRAALARRNGVAALDITDAQIMSWFTIRSAVPRFVYDWQDAFTGVAAGPGGAVALDELPATVNFVIYPAGTFTKAVADVVSLDTIYDAASLATNEYTAIFVEDGWAVLQTCPDVRQYTASVDPSGCVGCGGAGS